MRRKVIDFIRMGLCAALVCAAVPAFADQITCEDDDAYINPALTLCSTHVYNVGQTENPSDSASREMMKEVIALKTTVMTQQMYKQYEYLESMLKRFKTQLEKAVLNTKLAAAGAGTSTTSSLFGGGSSSSSSARNSNSYAVIDGAKDCNSIMEELEAYQCIQGNLSVVLGAVNDRKISEAAKQLNKDVEVWNSWKGSKPSECGYLSGETAVRNCITGMRRDVSKAIADYKDKYLKVKNNARE